MRPMSKKAKADGYDAVAAERDLWREFAHVHANGESADAREVIDHSTRPDLVDDDEAYVFELYRSLRAHAGILVEKFIRAGQSTQVNIYTFDEWAHQMALAPFGIGLSTERKIACERLTMARREIFERARECVHPSQADQDGPAS